MAGGGGGGEGGGGDDVFGFEIISSEHYLVTFGR